MELPSKILEQIAFNTRPKIEELMFFFMDKSTHGGRLSQALETNNKQAKTGVTFLTGFNGILNKTNKSNEFCFAKPITDKDYFIQINILQGG